MSGNNLADKHDVPMMVQLVKAMNWAHQSMQDEIDKSGIEPFNVNQGIILSNILLGINRPSDLARELSVSRQAVSIILKGLEKRKIIELVSDPSHKLAKVVRILPEAESDGKLKIIHEARLATELRLKRRIGNAKYKNLLEALNEDWGPASKVETKK